MQGAAESQMGEADTRPRLAVPHQGQRRPAGSAGAPFLPHRPGECGPRGGQAGQVVGLRALRRCDGLPLMGFPNVLAQDTRVPDKVTRGSPGSPTARRDEPRHRALH
ncbi:hypothetical protein GCM10010094_34000 [Streptomyces flaveus]|uniref:Uncharacterized protein n=1 Tax=Streptomyces flaveus TaxID=66370 RepID=A0A917VFF2_9ACTN|nr:hypothetical protein GCM10010094_34000 [Streptomyces flaveus]